MDSQLIELKLENVEYRTEQLQDEVRALRGEVELLRQLLAHVLDALPDGPLTWTRAKAVTRDKAATARDHATEDAIERFQKLLSGEE